MKKEGNRFGGSSRMASDSETSIGFGASSSSSDKVCTVVSRVAIAFGSNTRGIKYKRQSAETFGPGFFPERGSTFQQWKFATYAVMVFNVWGTLNLFFDMGIIKTNLLFPHAMSVLWENTAWSGGKLLVSLKTPVVFFVLRTTWQHRSWNHASRNDRLNRYWMFVNQNWKFGY